MREDGYSERFQKHLPRSNDSTLIVLKGHLLMEEIINDLLAALLPNPKALPDLKTYSRLRLLRALLPPDDFDMLDAAEKLNTLRNKLAHHLEHPEIENYITAFLRSLESPDVPIDEFEKETKAKRLKRCIAYLCGELSGFTRGMELLKKSSK